MCWQASLGCNMMSVISGPLSENFVTKDLPTTLAELTQVSPSQFPVGQLGFMISSRPDIRGILVLTQLVVS